MIKERTDFYSFLADNRERIIARCELLAEERSILKPQKAALNYAIPLFFDQFTDWIKFNPRRDGINAHSQHSATAYGEKVFRSGFTLSQVVESYSTLCEAILTTAQDETQEIQPHDAAMLNLWLDDAVANAVTGFEARKDKEARRAQDEKVRKLRADHLSQIGELVHELRRQLAAASLSYELIRTRRLSVSGRTGELLGRKLDNLRKIIDHSIAEIFAKGKYEIAASPLGLADLFDEVLATVRILAEKNGVKLSSTIPADVPLLGDRHLLASAISNLVENGIKYSKPQGNVSLRGTLKNGCAVIEIADECGGVRHGKLGDVTRPFKKIHGRGGGLGLGLRIAREAVKKHNGSLAFRNHPGKGCVFTIHLPAEAGAPKTGSGR